MFFFLYKNLMHDINFYISNVQKIYLSMHINNRTGIMHYIIIEQSCLKDKLIKIDF